MVGAGLDVFVEPLGDVRGGAVRDDRVDQPVAAGLGHVLVGETEPLPVVHVVAQIQVEADRLAANRPRFVGVGGQHHLVLRRQKHRVADQFARLRGVFRRGQVRMGAGAALRGQLQHLRSERGDDPPAGGHRGGVEFVEVFHQHLVGLAVLLGVLRMADADPEQEAAGEGLLDAVI